MKNSVFRTARQSVLAGGLLVSGAALTTGCLQRDIIKQDPNTSNVFVEQLANSAIKTIDLLFVIDNSVSMGDKQAILKDAVPQMVRRLINPPCVSPDGVQSQSVAAGESCPSGLNREFAPVEDIHIGVISSSLGGHGGFTRSSEFPTCNSQTEGMNDRGHLIATVRSGVPASDPLGFLSWTGDGNAADQLVSDFAAQVGAPGENGCGFEAPLEAWYRFLVDPTPPADVVNGASGTDVTRDEQNNPLIDQALLAQREKFLRPEGLVAIVLLTDENDCSVMDGGDYYSNATAGYLVTTFGNDLNMKSRNMVVATDVCEQNPNDVCCFSCRQTGNIPDQCRSAAAVCDAEPNGQPLLADQDDRANARCFQNERRFGFDLLYPTDRYVSALSDGKIIDARTGELKDNPLLHGAGKNAGVFRPPGLVFFAGIVGVPWQDVATEESINNDKVMKYLTAGELLEANVQVGDKKVDRWAVILGEPGLAPSSPKCAGDNKDRACGQAPQLPADPFMIESIVERQAGLVNPISGDVIMDSSGTDPQANGINGHETNTLDTERFAGSPAKDDLQYACIFPLSTPKADCGPDDLSCDCGREPGKNRALCQPPAGGANETTQYWGKAYPGTRILQVLRDFGNNSIVGSICPKITESADPADPNFGYNPAVQAIVDRLKVVLGGSCLPRELTLREDGTVPCSVVEVKPGGLACEEGNGRAQPDATITAAILKQLKEGGRCDGDSPTSCSEYSLCSIQEIVQGAPGRDECLTNTGNTKDFANAGFCYIDPAKFVLKEDGSKEYVAGGGVDGTNAVIDSEGCPATQRRLLRFVGKETPADDTLIFVACSGDAPKADAAIPAVSTPTETAAP